MESKIKSFAAEYFPEIQEIRRHLHENPELSFEEFETSKYLKNKLEEWGLDIDATWVKSGFTVVIDSGKPGKTIALRADLDALPIHEKAQVEYKSKVEGKMHACGHDVHASCLMGVAKILQATKEEWSGRAVLFFQPGEEKLPGGASLMIEEGVLDLYKPDLMLAQHVYPEFEVGHVGFKSGMYMASADEIYLTVKGIGGHGALPHRNIDPIVISASIILELQTLVSRIAPPTLPTVLSFGKIIGEGATNVIPSVVKLEGTLRTFNEEWRATFHKRITEMCESIATAHGGECVVNIRKGYPFLVNDNDVTENSIQFSNQYLGKEFVQQLDLRMTAEDFAYFTQKVPSCFYRLGVGNKKRGINKSVHHPEFQVDEKALETGVGLMAYLAIQHLNN
ncbi:MAG: amidohydrolase [Vicingaceae bacterium]|jgi:amidohydrolase